MSEKKQSKKAENKKGLRNPLRPCNGKAFKKNPKATEKPYTRARANAAERIQGLRTTKYVNNMLIRANGGETGSNRTPKRAKTILAADPLAMRHLQIKLFGRANVSA